MLGPTLVDERVRLVTTAACPEPVAADEDELDEDGADDDVATACVVGSVCDADLVAICAGFELVITAGCVDWALDVVEDDDGWVDVDNELDWCGEKLLFNVLAFDWFKSSSFLSKDKKLYLNSLNYVRK